MDQQRQRAFQELRPVCVELSSIVLRFKGRQTTVKDVLRALEAQYQVLQSLGSANLLDEKLAEYAFFPLTHVFRESQKLSPRCMQVTVQSVTILISQGWRQRLAPEMGEQLLLLTCLLAGGDPRKQSQPPTDELKCAAFQCIATLIRCLASSSTGKTVLDGKSTNSIVDQLAYVLVESITDAASDIVQISAAEALIELNACVSNRVLLASLLPRTVSSLTKALRPSTQARRTRKVLITDLKLLGLALVTILADDVTFREDKEQSEREALGESWRKATTAQIKNALAQVCKLRTHDHSDVQGALLDLCVMLIEECNKTLEESIPVLVETAVVLSGTIHNEVAVSRLKVLLVTRPELGQTLESKFYDWTQSLPRLMQGNDDKPKDMMLARITNTFNILTETLPNSTNLTNILSSTILKSIVSTAEADRVRSVQVYDDPSDQYRSLIQQGPQHKSSFEPVLLNHQSQQESARRLHSLIRDLQQHPSVGRMTRDVIDSIQYVAQDQKVSPIWMALQLLRPQPASSLELDDILDLAVVDHDRDTSRAYLIQDLYIQTKNILLDSSPYSPDQKLDVRLVALALESVALQAQQLGQAYRTELYETLYPILALLSSKDHFIQNHAITTLNFVTSSCKYGSVSALLIENVDYLVNSIAWKLNTFNLSPEAPMVLNMIVRLIGAKVVPFLDDLIASIFAALDSFHGYPQWVEMLFEVLRTMVDESTKEPELSIADGQEASFRPKLAPQVSAVTDITSDLQSRKRRKVLSGTSARTDQQESAPQRPWTKAQDDPTYMPDPTEGKDLETLLREAETADEENNLPTPDAAKEEDPTKPLNKSHDLLLQIARATVPHLSNPSPRVRHTLLQLLAQIGPLLARHENTFLPLINAIWPGLVQRLFADITTSASSEEEQVLGSELAYNVATAADVIAGLCEASGDFMATRIEQIFGQLKSLYLRVRKEIEAQMSRNQDRAVTAKSAIEDTSGRHIKGVVDLHVIKQDSITAKDLAPAKDFHHSSSALSAASRTGAGQIFNSLARLLVVVLGHVRLSDDNADEVFSMLAPLMQYPGGVGEMVGKALETHNPDMVWVMQCRERGEDEIIQGVRTSSDRIWRDIDTPVLRRSLDGAGFRLRPLVF